MKIIIHNIGITYYILSLCGNDIQFLYTQLQLIKYLLNMTEFIKRENYSDNNEDNEENDEEDTIVEYLEIDSEVMDTLQDPNDYFSQVNQSHQGPIYVQQSAVNTPQQLSLVIQNSSNEYTQLKQMPSHHVENHNGLTNVLWSNTILDLNDKKTNGKKENSYSVTNERRNCETQRKRKIEYLNSPNSKSKCSNLNQNDTIKTINESIQGESDSLDLFFQSMAQTVSHLPSQIQAKIKMEICNVISMAEIKYCSNETTLHNQSNEGFNSKN